MAFADTLAQDPTLLAKLPTNSDGMTAIDKSTRKPKMSRIDTSETLQDGAG